MKWTSDDIGNNTYIYIWPGWLAGNLGRPRSTSKARQEIVSLSVSCRRCRLWYYCGSVQWNRYSHTTIHSSFGHRREWQKRTIASNKQPLCVWHRLHRFWHVTRFIKFQLDSNWIPIAPEKWRAISFSHLINGHRSYRSRGHQTSLQTSAHPPNGLWFCVLFIECSEMITMLNSFGQLRVWRQRTGVLLFIPSSVAAGRVVEDIHRISIFGSFVLRWRSLEDFRTLPCGRSRWPGQCFSAHNPLCLPEDHWLTLGSIGIVVPREMVPTGMLFWRHHPCAGSHNKLVFCLFGGQIAIAIKMH